MSTVANIADIRATIIIILKLPFVLDWALSQVSRCRALILLKMSTGFCKTGHSGLCINFGHSGRSHESGSPNANLDILALEARNELSQYLLGDRYWLVQFFHPSSARSVQ